MRSKRVNQAAPWPSGVRRRIYNPIAFLGASLPALDVAPSLRPFDSWSNAIEAQNGQNPPGNTLTIDAKLVPVRMVVRDSKGNAVGGLTKDDFRILDDGQEQVILQFFADHSGGAGSQPTAPGQAALEANVERI
jgi:hypothetical protein